MADQKLSQLTNITSLADSDEFYTTDPDSKAVDYSVLRDAIRAGGSGSGNFGFGSSKLNVFLLHLKNTSGYLEHRFLMNPWDNASATPMLGGGINGASTSFTATPDGNDSTTPFAAGAKILSINTSNLVFDTADLSSKLSEIPCLGPAVVTINGTPTPDIWVYPSVISWNINGTTRTRLYFAFYAGSFTNPFDLTATSSTDEIRVAYAGFLPDYA